MADREKEVIVTNDGGGGGAGMLIGVILVLAVIAVLFFVFKDNILGSNTKAIDADIKIETPSAPPSK